MQDSSEIFAAYTLSRITRELADQPLTEVQRNRIRASLVDQGRTNRHALDVRLVIPLIYTRFYLVLFSGTDQRSKKKTDQSTKDSSEIFADFTLQRVNRDLLDEPLDSDQQRRFREVLIAQNRSNQHAIDIRFTIPLLFTRIYVVLFAGKDRRAKTIAIEVRRASTTAITILSIPLLLALVWIGYLFKSALGINLFNNWHFSEFVYDLLDKIERL